MNSEQRDRLKTSRRTTTIARKIRRGRRLIGRVGTLYSVARLQQMERNVDDGFDRYRLAVFLPRQEAPFLHRFDCLLIQTQAQRFYHLDFLGQTLFVDDDAQPDGTCPLGLASFFGILGLRLEGRLRGRNAATDLVSSAADSAAAARTYTVASARSDAFADTVSGPGKSDARQRIAVVHRRHVGQIRSHDGRAVGQLRILDGHLWRSKLLRRNLRQLGLSNCLIRAAAAAFGDLFLRSRLMLHDWRGQRYDRLDGSLHRL